MDPRAEQFIARAKEALTAVHQSLRNNPAHWRINTSAVKTSIQYVDQSRIMYDPRRIEERVWIITEVQLFASFDPGDGAIRDVNDWCEREWNSALHVDPCNAAILTGLGNLWLSKAQNVLARIHRQERATGHIDDLAADRRAGTADYHEARTILQPAIDFFARAVEIAQSQGRLTGELLVKVESCSTTNEISPS
ncbi:hypothetical protein FN846DRAFT_746512 [Sphaerosporella brunnea]|uniref:Uncharacterized protein n=1 Tax=Sphaerosporella brunnea TaxID=1250544 RepID=A0A5J5EWF3_9PEZI|nr:hypothetical protein FN846DRAFT_746512 [Sphaerosporella brunnea]